MNKKFIKLSIIPIFLILSTSLFSCADTTKKVTISNNTQNEILVDENEISKAMSTGEKYLSEGNFDEAKAYFNKAISLDKGNKDIYLKIKDKYMSLNRYDDAYFIIKTALTNNVDIENMKLVLKEISSNFDAIKLSSSIYQDSNYSLPTEVNATINEYAVSLPIYWNNPQVDSSSPGTFIYEGLNEEYGRRVEMEITVLENIYDKQIGCINNIYTIDGKTYIDVDLVEFYRGREESLREFLKDNKDKDKIDLPTDDKGEYYVPDSYYIRNKSSKITTYEISNNCTFQLLDHDLISLGYNITPKANSSIPENVSFEKFKAYIDSRAHMNVSEDLQNLERPITDRSILCWIELKNGAAYSIYRQYTP